MHVCINRKNIQHQNTHNNYNRSPINCMRVLTLNSVREYVVNV